jgi:rubrerythrin
MTEEKTQIVKAPIEVNGKGIVLHTFEDMYRFATAVQQSGLAPSSFDKPEKILIAVQMGAELGMTPMRALQSFAVVNGNARLWGDAPLALVKQSGLLEYHKEFIEGEIGADLNETPEEVKAVCITKRKGDPEEKRTEFSVGDAVRADLWNKKTFKGFDSVWMKYPKRMLAMRARALNLRDNFPDALCGQTIAEEYEGIQPEAAYSPETPKRGEREAKPVASTVTDTPKPDTGEILQKIADALEKRILEKYGMQLTDEQAKRVFLEWADTLIDFADLLDENKNATVADNPLTWPMSFCEKYLATVEDYLLPIPAQIEAIFKPQASQDAKTTLDPTDDTPEAKIVDSTASSNAPKIVEAKKAWLCKLCGATFDKYTLTPYVKGKPSKRQCPACLAIGKVTANQ